MNTKISNIISSYRKKEPRKEYQMALELVEPGNGDSDSYGQQERVSKKLPLGVSSRMLYTDIVRIAWPALLEFILTQIVSMVDMMMVGQLGPWAIAAVGLTTQPKFLLMTMFMAMNVGSTALIARHKGEGITKGQTWFCVRHCCLPLCYPLYLQLSDSYSQNLWFVLWEHLMNRL